MNLNHFVISGNVTRDLELRYLPSGSAVVTYTVATNFVRFDDGGNKTEHVDFIPVTTFGKQAERHAKYLKKGSPVGRRPHRKLVRSRGQARGLQLQGGQRRIRRAGRLRPAQRLG
jgi:single stranded DNA-binding protein